MGEGIGRNFAAKGSEPSIVNQVTLQNMSSVSYNDDGF